MRPSFLITLLVAGAAAWPVSPARASWHAHPLNVVAPRKGLEDRAGNLWFASGSGVVRFDGQTWRLFTAADGLGTSSAWAITEDRAGRIWAGTEIGGGTRGGLNWFDGATWHNIAADTAPQFSGVSALAVDDSGHVWAASDQTGIAEFDGTTWKRFGPAEGVILNTYSDLLADYAGNIWASGSSGISRWDGHAWTTYGMAQGLLSDFVNDLFLDRDGRVWEAGGGVGRFDDPGWTMYTAANGLVATPTAKLAQDASGSLWAVSISFPIPGGTRGASRFDGVGTWTPYTTASGIASDFVDGLVADSAGAVWIGSLSEGLSRFRSERWRVFSTADGLPSTELTPLFADRSGRVWARSGERIAHFDGPTPRAFTTANGMSADRVGSLLADRAGGLWAASLSTGLFHWDGRSWTRYTTANGLGSDRIGSLIEDRAGRIWAAAAGVGCSRWDGVTWQTFGSADGLGTGSIGPFALDRAGNVWLASDSGASRFDGQAWRTFKKSDGLGSDYVLDMAVDSLGGVWAATLYGGVSRFDGTAWNTFSVIDSLDLTGTFVTAMQSDRTGGLWLVAGGIVAYYDGENWNAFGLGQGPPSPAGSRVLVDSQNHVWVVLPGVGVSRFDGHDWRTFSSADGLGSLNVNALLEDRTGAIWAGTLGGGASRFDGTTWRTYSAKDGLGDDTVSPMAEDTSGTLWLGHRDRGITELEPDLVPPQTLVFSVPPPMGSSQYVTARFDATLEDVGTATFSTAWTLDPEWSPFSTANGWSATLPVDGDYVFHVRARDLWGNVDPTPAESRFTLDATAPAASISSPSAGGALRDVATVRGTADDLRFFGYRVELRPAASPSASWQLLGEGFAAVRDEALASFDTRELADGDYEIRLSVRDTLGLTGSTSVIAEVDNTAPYADQTSPVRVSARSGGDVWTADAALHLYLPPDALTEDTTVKLDRLADEEAPATLSSGAVRVGPVFLQDVGATPLLKLGRVEVKSPVGTLYEESPGGSWERLGGTRDGSGGVLAAPAGGSGRFALYDDGGVSPGVSLRADLRLSPRVFSPGGRGANSVAIQFSLPSAATTTIRVYNRAGRLIRVVMDGRPLGPGAQSVLWPGTDDEGRVVSDGLYLVQVEAAEWKQTLPVSVVR